MLTKNSPSKSTFPYYYKGGQLFGLHWGSYGADEDKLITMIKAEETFFLAQYCRIGIWIDFYETKLTGRVIGEFIQFLEHTHHLIPKLGLVGCSVLDKWRINRQIKKAACLLTLPVRYFKDPEDAKTWLVTESG